MLSLVYWKDSVPSSSQILLKVSTSVGNVISQVSFGISADIVGRKKINDLEFIIFIGATILQCASTHSPVVNFVTILTFYRIIMGIGIRGDYQLSLLNSLL